MSHLIVNVFPEFLILKTTIFHTSVIHLLIYNIINFLLICNEPMCNHNRQTTHHSFLKCNHHGKFRLLLKHFLYIINNS